MNILIVCPESPYPANHGGRLDIMQRIIVCSELGYDIDLLLTDNDLTLSDDNEHHLKKYVNEVYKVDRKKGLVSGLLSIVLAYPYQIISRRKLSSIVIGKTYDLILCESDYVYWVLKNKSISYVQAYLRVHNNEENYYRALMYSNKGLKRCYYLFEYILFSFRRANLYSAFDRLLFISKDEEQYFLNEKLSRVNHYATKITQVWLPPHMLCMDKFDIDKFSLHSKKLLFVGSLFMGNNIDGLVWFLDEVFPTILKHDPSVILTIAGNGKNGVPDRLTKALKQYYENKCIKLILSPSDSELHNLYKSHCIFINPMRYGAGLKLKSIDALRNSMSMVSTSIGIEGTGLSPDSHFCLANSKEEFISHITLLLQQTMTQVYFAKNGFLFIKTHYDMKNNIQNLFVG